MSKEIVMANIFFHLKNSLILLLFSRINYTSIYLKLIMKLCHYILVILVLIFGFNVDNMNSSYIGCFYIYSSVSFANESSYADYYNNTVGKCVGFCQGKKLRYSLLGYG